MGRIQQRANEAEANIRAMETPMELPEGKPRQSKKNQ